MFPEINLFPAEFSEYSKKIREYCPYLETIEMWNTCWKRGYFCWKFRENVGKIFHVVVIFTILLPLPV